MTVGMGIRLVVAAVIGAVMGFVSLELFTIGIGLSLIALVLVALLIRSDPGGRGYS